MFIRSRLILCMLLSLGSLSIRTFVFAQDLSIGSKTVNVDDVDTLGSAAPGIMQVKDRPSAYGIWDRHIVVNPGSKYGHRMRGNTKLEVERLDEAITSYQNSIELKPQEIAGWNGLCWALIVANKPREAKDKCAKAVELAPNDYVTLLRLGHTYLLQGDSKTAKELYKRMLLDIDQYRQLKDGPLGDFDFFIAKKWNVEKIRDAKRWLEYVGKNWLLKIEPIQQMQRKAIDEFKQGNYSLGLEAGLQLKKMIPEILGENHPKSKVNVQLLEMFQESLAEQLFRNGEFEKALHYYRQFTDSPNFRHQFQDYGAKLKILNVAKSLQQLGRYDIANIFYELADVMEESRTIYFSINRTTKLAVKFREIGEHALAESLYLYSFEMAEKLYGKLDRNVVAALNNLGQFYFDLGSYEASERFFLRALDVAKQNGKVGANEIASIESNLGSLNIKTADYLQAELYLTKSLKRSETVDGFESSSYGTRLHNLGSLYEKLGRYSLAESMFLRAIKISEIADGPFHPNTGASLNNLAHLYHANGNYSGAESIYRRALEIAKGQSQYDNPRISATLSNLGSLFVDMKRYDEAEKLLLEALNLSEKSNGQEHTDTAFRLNNLAHLYHLIERNSEAESFFQKSLRIAAQVGVPELEWTVQGNLRSFYAKTNPDLAIWYGKQAVNTLQRVRAMNTGLDKDTQKSFLQKNESTYKSLADLLFARGRLAEGQQVLAMLKESEYFDFLQRSSNSDPRKTRADFTDQERPWTERYSMIEKQLASLGKEAEVLREKSKKVELSAEEVKRKEQLDADLVVARQAFDAFAVELKNEFTQNQTSNRSEKERIESYGAKNLAGLTKLQGTLRELTQSSKAGVVSLHYLMTEQRLWILLTTPTVQLKREVGIKEADLNRQIGEYRAAIAERSPKVKELGKALYDVILAPVVDDLKQADAKTLMVSLDGSLRYLPIAALYDGNRYVAQRYRLSLLTSADYQDFKEAPRGQWTFAGYGLTQKIDDFNPLPAVQGELEGMKRDMKGQVKLNQEFTSKTLKAGLEKEPPVVHVASHFVFKPGNQSDSFLLLGDGKRLSLKDINEQYQFINLDLLTLSACETAVGGGKDQNGKEVEGFAMLAQQKGAKSVLASLWNVNDESTGQFMQLFYGYRQKNPGMSKAQAIQMAQQAFIEGKVKPSLAQVRRAAESIDREGKVSGIAVTSTDHPYYWAPFILMGNWL